MINMIFINTLKKTSKNILLHHMECTDAEEFILKKKLQGKKDSCSLLEQGQPLSNDMVVNHQNMMLILA